MNEEKINSVLDKRPSEKENLWLYTKELENYILLLENTLLKISFKKAHLDFETWKELYDKTQGEGIYIYDKTEAILSDIQTAYKFYCNSID